MSLTVRDLGLNLRPGEYDKAYVRKSAALSMGHSFQVIYVSLNAVGHRLVEIIKLVILALLGNRVFSTDNPLNHSFVSNRQRVAKIMVGVVLLGLCGFLIARKIKRGALPDEETGPRKAPCNPIVTAHEFDFNGCSLEEIKAAHAEYKKLLEKEEEDDYLRMKQAGKDAVDNDLDLKSYRQALLRLAESEKRQQERQIKWEAMEREEIEAFKKKYRNSRYDPDCKSQLYDYDEYERLTWKDRLWVDATCRYNAESILGIDVEAGENAIKKRYRTLAKLYHPDKNSFPEAQGAFNLLATAYHKLIQK